MTEKFVLVDVGERRLSIHGQGEHWDSKSKCVRGAIEIEPDTEIRVIRRGSIRFFVVFLDIFIAEMYAYRLPPVSLSTIFFSLSR